MNADTTTTSLTPDPPEAVGPVAWIAARVGLDEGQAWSVAVATAASALLITFGLPSVLTFDPAAAGPPPRLAGDTPPAASPAVSDPDPDLDPDPPGTVAPGADALTLPLPRVGPSATQRLPEPPLAPDPTATGVEGVGPIVIIPLSIVTGGTVSATSGVPDARPDTEVTEGGVAVEARAGADVARSFVRLAGTAQVLRLRLVNDPTASYLDATARVDLCKVLDENWTIEAGVVVGPGPGQGPDYDADDCASGARSESGTWSWDLTDRDDITDTAGWAMVPRPSGIDSWRVTFAERGLQTGATRPDAAAVTGLVGQPTGSDATRNPTFPALLRGVLAERADTR